MDPTNDISFAWTTPAVRAFQKDVTRREWKDNYAARFEAGDLLYALNKQRRFGGEPFGLIKLTQKPYYESEFDMPDRDYEGEGFGFLDRHPEYKPPRWAGIDLRAYFEESRREGAYVWVVRFEIVEIYKPLLIDGIAIANAAASL